MNALQQLLQSDKEALLRSNLSPAKEREAYDVINEAMHLAGELQQADAEVSAHTVGQVWPLIDALTDNEAAGVVLMLCSRMGVRATMTEDKPTDEGPKSAEIPGLPTDRQVSPEGVEQTLESARSGTEPSPGPGGPAGRANPAPEDDLGELDPSKACNLQDGECESCQ